MEGGGEEVEREGESREEAQVMRCSTVRLSVLGRDKEDNTRHGRHSTRECRLCVSTTHSSAHNHRFTQREV